MQILCGRNSRSGGNKITKTYGFTKSVYLNAVHSKVLHQQTVRKVFKVIHVSVNKHKDVLKLKRHCIEKHAQKLFNSTYFQAFK